MTEFSGMRGPFLATTVALALFFGLGWAMMVGLTDGLDRSLVLALRVPGDPGAPLGGRGVVQNFQDITALGGTLVVTGITILSGVVLVLQRRRWYGLALLGSVVLSLVLSDLAKVLYGRARPDLVPHEVHVTSASFPSGHATHAAALYVMLAIIVAGLTPRRRIKALTFVASGSLVAAIGFSRVYLGVHYPSDVLAGWALGTLCALLPWMALQTAIRRKR